MATPPDDESRRSRFAADPRGFVEELIKDFVRTSPDNRLAHFEDGPIFDEPLVGFASGDDPLFDELKRIIDEEHFSPREIFTRHLRETLQIDPGDFPDLSVVSFVLPITAETRRSNAAEKEGPSLRWNHTRWIGQAFINTLSAHVVSVLSDLGVQAVAPDLTPFFRMYAPAGNIISNWSHRHVAYAAGLGTFSLNDGFITPRGLAIRCGSIVAGLKLAPSPRAFEHHLANCLFHATGKCGVCIRRCPGGAISEKGHDKAKCLEVLFERQKSWIEGAHGPGYMGQYAGCGLCQTGVPCESGIPVKTEK